MGEDDMITEYRSGRIVASGIFSLLLVSACSSGGGGDDSSNGGGGGPLPAVVHINKVPDQTVYGLGEPVEITTLVLDSAGATLANASVQLASNPPAAQTVGNRFVYLSDGTYTITAMVQGDTHNGVAVTASVTILVDGNGPTIACADPIDGAILDQAPGQVTVTGSVDDLNGVSVFSVNGATVAVDASGSFTTPIDAIWGINFVSLAATDGVGRQARRTCAFLLSETWAPDDGILADTVSLKARQSAFDDNSSAGAVNSVADVLRTVLNSPGLRNELDANLRSNNPLHPYTCYAFLITCLASNTTDYLDLQFSTNNNVALQLVNGGLSARTTLSAVSVRVRAHGQLSGIPYDVNGWLRFNDIRISMIVDASLAQGRPSMVVRPGTLDVSIGSVSVDFTGTGSNILDFLFNTVDLVFQVRSKLAAVVGDLIKDSVPDTVDGIVAGLDVHNLAAAFDVPRVDGAGPVTIDFATNFSTFDMSAIRMLATMGTRFQASPAHARPTLGAPIPPGDRLLDVTTSDAIATALHVGLLDQAFHALWRGGYFDATLAGGALNGLVQAGVTLELTSALPPAADLRDDGRLEISLGSVNVRLEDPAHFNEPIEGSLGGRVSCAMDLNGEALAVSDCTVHELHASTGNTALDVQITIAVEELLTNALNSILSSVVEDALPALPIPSFELPASLATYGLSGELGLINPSFSIQGDHAVLEGAFGIKTPHPPPTLPILPVLP